LVGETKWSRRCDDGTWYISVYREVQVNLAQQVPQVKQVLLGRLDLKDLVATLDRQVVRVVLEIQVTVNCTTYMCNTSVLNNHKH